MVNILARFPDSVYSAISPLLGAISPTCEVNGKMVACPNFIPPGDSVGIFAGLTALFLFFPALMFVFLIIMIVAMWIIFEKAGKPGWTAIIPVYNSVILLQIIKKPVWWVILLFIPIVNIIVSFIMVYHLALAFGKSLGFAIGLIFLPFIFYPILAFGKSTYTLGGQSNFTVNIPPQSMPPQQGI